MIEFILMLIYVMSFFLGGFGVIYFLINDLVFMAIVSIIFFVATCIRIDCFLDRVDRADDDDDE